MLEPVEGIPTFGESTRADAIIAGADGRGEHVPFQANSEGITAAAREIAGLDFPRTDLAELLTSYNRAIGSAGPALENAARVARPDTLIVATGQQPLAAGGPLYVVYKALTAIKLAREAEGALGVPVVPVFWTASEDHDLEEAARASAPGRSGELVGFRADLSTWRGKPLSAVGPDPVWHDAAREWIESLPGAGEAREVGRVFAPREGEGWARWFSRAIAELLGPEGLVVIEPQSLRALAAGVFARAIRKWREVVSLIGASCDERAGPEAAASFEALGGPPVFIEREGFRRRVLERDGKLALRGEDAAFEVDQLARLAEEEPERFSSHAALRPIVQNALMPVVAQVVGPGEIAYHEELYRFHRSELGAGRRMPILWPRMSATCLDARSAGTMSRFGMRPRDVFLPEAELVARFTPSGELCRRVADSGRSAEEALARLEPEVLSLDATLRRPLEKTLDTVRRAHGTLGSKVAAAEARARGFAPEKLGALARWVRPGGKPQERVFAACSILARAGEGFPARVLAELDVFDHRHHLVRFPEGAPR